MKRAIYLFLCILTCAAFITACGKKETTSSQGAAAQGTDSTKATVNQEATTKAPESTTKVPDEEVINPAPEEEPGDEDLNSEDEKNNVPIGDASDEDVEGESESKADSDTTDVQNKVNENPSEEFNGSGTFNGFVDSSSVEITMSDGSYQTFFVYDEDVLAQLQKLDEKGDSPKIQFTYRGVEGQVNPEIISVQ